MKSHFDIQTEKCILRRMKSTFIVIVSDKQIDFYFYVKIIQCCNSVNTDVVQSPKISFNYTFLVAYTQNPCNNNTVIYIFSSFANNLSSTSKSSSTTSQYFIIIVPLWLHKSTGLCKKNPSTTLIILLIVLLLVFKEPLACFHICHCRINNMIS